MLKLVERFCAKHRRFGITNLMLYVVAVQAIIYVISLMDKTGSLYSLLRLDPARVMQGQVWRLVTFVLIPDSGGLWLVVELYFYYFIGTVIESVWGAGKFTFYYLFGLVITVLYSMLAYLLLRWYVPATAHYLNLSLFFTFATLSPDSLVRVYMVVPIRAKWIALVDLLFFVYEVLTLPMGLNLLPVAAVLNYLLFCGGILVDYMRPGRARYSAGSINFRRAVRNIKKEEQNRNYTRKCTVCGKTDTDYPTLSFRYCSHCEGYHCFCEEHINNHVHIEES